MWCFGFYQTNMVFIKFPYLNTNNPLKLLSQAPLILFVIMHYKFGFLNIKCNGYSSKGGIQNYQGHIFYVIIVMYWFFLL
jgi:hypothetical protein